MFELLTTSKKNLLTTSYYNYFNTGGYNVSSNIDDKLVFTVIKINENDNVTALIFRNLMELRLANIYNDALTSSNNININNLFKRVKRYSTYQNASIQMINTSLGYDGDLSQSMLLYYLVESSNSMNATIAKRTVDLMNKLIIKYSIQYVSLKLGHIITIPAQTYLVDPTSPANNLWIIGVVIGCLIFLFVIFWCIAFVYIKCTRPRKLNSSKHKNLSGNIIFIEKMFKNIQKSNIETQTTTERKLPPLVHSINNETEIIRTGNKTNLMNFFETYECKEFGQQFNSFNQFAEINKNTTNKCINNSVQSDGNKEDAYIKNKKGNKCKNQKHEAIFLNRIEGPFYNDINHPDFVQIALQANKIIEENNKQCFTQFDSIDPMAEPYIKETINSNKTKKKKVPTATLR